MTAIRITTATPIWRGIAAGIGYGAFSAAVKYLAEGHVSLRESLEVGCYFGAMFWGFMSLVSENGQINGLLRRIGWINQRGEEEEH